MSFNQDDKTKKFLQQAKNLVESGIEPTYKAIAEKIGWNHNSFSLTVNGRRNVPYEVYKKFTEVYKPEEENTPEDDSDYKAKYIAMLERQVKEQARQLSELKDRMDSRTLQITEQIDKLSSSLAAHDRVARLALGYCKFLYQRWGPMEYKLFQHFLQDQKKAPTVQEQRELKKVLDDLDTQLVQVLEAELISEKDN
jgi:hypothetical protein